MYMYDIYLKDGTRKVFYQDEISPCEKVKNFLHNNEYKDYYVNHFPISVHGYVGSSILKDYEEIVGIAYDTIV